MKSAEFRVPSAELKDRPQAGATAVDGFPGIKQVASGYQPSPDYKIPPTFLRGIYHSTKVLK
ncbi:hypothetical protein [Nostoc sp. 'Lobaria pulmonaria (5183) cyanobiont']|uniref:hypothetical protein n=1 Tax=Nostoc sp. 'Lobaria pulmonaria (5183) cyanobiont' TaxID=1618022 RepID=UPI000CF3444F|nr:hypothetical protein [Nostoc sp. 'Lobaria pulmonaria (5183) cyanobiont']